MKLSQQRAESVVKFFEAAGIPRSRMMEKWYGETQPKYPNDSDTNREKNRRVELAIYANEDMKKQAQEGNIKE
jgi:outer membrane protein OmpA-like peptidoglycan-associated protein